VTVEVLGHLTVQLMQRRPATQQDINRSINTSGNFSLIKVDIVSYFY